MEIEAKQIPRTMIIQLEDGKINSTIKIGYIYIYQTRKFNWLQKKMIAAVFGFEVFDGLKEADEDDGI